MQPPFFVDCERLCELHVQAIERWGGAWAEPKIGCLDGATNGALTAMRYHSDAQPDVLVYACFLLRYLALNHCLVDGNKRVAWMAFVEALAVVGLTVDVTEDDAAKFVEETVIVTQAAVETIAQWVAERLAAL